MLKSYKYSLAISLIICYLCLKSSTNFDEIKVLNFPHMDKVAHFCMYFGFMSALIFETYIINKKRHSFFALALIPLFFGIVMEFLQSVFTATRNASIYDVLFNTLGILLAIAFWPVVESVYNKLFK